MLEKADPPRRIDRTPLDLAKARAADAGGSPQKAYDMLLKAMGGAPTEALNDALLSYGEKLGHDREQIAADVRKLLDSKATPAKDFSLPRYGDEKRYSLADFRGKVVLLSFWYPMCGPCRGGSLTCNGHSTNSPRRNL